MRNRSIVLLSLLVVAGMLFAACSAPSAPAEPAAAPAEEEAAAVEAEAEPTEAPAEEAAPAADGPSLTIWADDTRAPVSGGTGQGLRGPVRHSRGRHREGLRRHP